MGPTPLPGLGAGPRDAWESPGGHGWVVLSPPTPRSLSYLDQLKGEALMEDAVDAGSPRQFIGVNLVP